MGMGIELSYPVAHGIERVLRGAIVGKDNAIGFIEVLHGHSTETFLTGCVPHQKFDVLTINLNILDLKIDTNSGNVLCSEFIICEFLE
jgi:hypothetical protein